MKPPYWAWYLNLQVRRNGPDERGSEEEAQTLVSSNTSRAFALNMNSLPQEIDPTVMMLLSRYEVDDEKEFMTKISELVKAR